MRIIGRGRPEWSSEGRGKILPMGWRSKFVFVLIVYFAGFATAVYCLAPAPEGKHAAARQRSSVFAGVKSEELAQSVNSGVHKCLDLGKEAAREAAKLIKEKMDEAKARSQKK